MAAVACTASALGRPASRVRLLALAITGAVLLDPLLVRSIGFQLSVGATAGIALLARPIEVRLRGPGWLRETVAVTIAAQAGVLPIALPAFGGVPVASLPANVLAAPVPGPLTIWGLLAGLVAGRVPSPWDRWLHVPTRVLTDWLAGVAHWSAGLPLGAVRWPHVAAVAVTWCVGAALRRARRVRAIPER
jgi:competence protein ComEC